MLPVFVSDASLQYRFLLPWASCVCHVVTVTDFVFLTVLQIKQESFLEDINNMLNAGEVPNLFQIDEKQEICEKMRQIDR